MATVTATYNAPEDDGQVVTTRGVRFFDGQAVELDTERHAELIGKLRTNPHFSVMDADEADQIDEDKSTPPAKSW